MPAHNLIALLDDIASVLDDIAGPGSYQFVNHGKDISADIKSSVAATLAAGGAVSGSVSDPGSIAAIAA